jgi:hypothetical protein
VQFPTEDGVRLYEIKSFTGRLRDPQRRQVKDSLAQAAGLHPLDWTLVVPIDPNPSELAWFERLQDTVAFPIRWRGLTWLDAEYAARPSIARYYIDGAKDELVELAHLFDREQAALARGALDVIDRVRDLARLADEIDPHYRIKITTDDGKVSIALVPRYPGAERDRPIRGSIQVVFPTDEAGLMAAADFRRAIEYGTHVVVPRAYSQHATLDAPAGLGGEFDEVVIELGSPEAPDVVHPTVLEVVSPTGRVLSGVEISLRLSSSGAVGAIFSGTDPSGWLATTWEVSAQSRTGSFEISVRASEYFPAAVHPVAQLLTHAVRPNRLRLVTTTGEVLAEAPIPSESPLIGAEYTSLIEDLALIQWASRTIRKVPVRLGPQDLREVAAGAAVLRGEVLEASWNSVSIKLAPDAAEDARRDLATRRLSLDLGTDAPYVAEIAGAEYQLGAGVQTHLESAVLAPEFEEMRAAGIVPAGAQVRMVPGTSRVARISLVSSAPLPRGQIDSSTLSARSILDVEEA